MKWLDWLRKQVTTEQDAAQQGKTVAHSANPLSENDSPDMPPSDAGDVPPEVAGLDFYSAIATHQRWKNRLKDVVRGQSQETLVAAVVARSDVCVLGQWLATQQGNARIPAHLMAELQEEHAAFHRIAADIIRLADQGQTQQALDALRTDAPYSRVSHRVTKLLSQIFLELSEFHQSDLHP